MVLTVWIATGAMPPHARADFRIEGKLDTPSAVPTAPSPPQTGTTSMNALPKSGMSSNVLGDRSPADGAGNGSESGRAATVSRYARAKGFGEGVPLAFAARQIVPTTVTVQFARGIDREAPVNWTGGRPWNRVLAAAVAPLGLRVTAGSSTVLISR